MIGLRVFLYCGSDRHVGRRIPVANLAVDLEAGRVIETGGVHKSRADMVRKGWRRGAGTVRKGRTRTGIWEGFDDDNQPFEKMSLEERRAYQGGMRMKAVLHCRECGEARDLKLTDQNFTEAVLAAVEAGESELSLAALAAIVATKNRGRE